MLEHLREKFYKKLDRVTLEFSRYLLGTIDWNNRLIGIRGARGTGKTTLLLQHIRKSLPNDYQTLYVSLDDLYFTTHKLVDVVDQFVKEGGRFLLLDEVHRYKGWSQEIKNIYDDHPDLQIIFTGSSILHLNQARGDLSRRAVSYDLHGLSYREFLNYSGNKTFNPIDLNELMTGHHQLSREIISRMRPLENFRRYLRLGYFPYFRENENAYHEKLSETLLLALHTDLPAIREISYPSIEKIKALLYVIAHSVPFKPNIAKLSERTGVTRVTLLQFLHDLEDLRIIRRLYSSTRGIGYLQKPEKIYLYHPNLHYALSPGEVNAGNLRESFFASQLQVLGPLAYPSQGDFAFDQYIFEVGGKSKTMKQVIGLPEGYVVSDDIEIGHGRKIPLWLFGFLY